jgi:predicted ATPase
MRATLDWSHGLSTDKQQVVLRRLSVFDEVTELVAKSLMVSEVREAPPRFRLSHLTRAYALEKLRESGEFDAIGHRLADYLKATGATQSARFERKNGADAHH